jgi:diguanylate cyclase (GGDEF)-like protein/PAS domain S-box-containing protein
MRHKIVLYITALFIFSATGTIFTTLYIKDTVGTLSRLINLHQSKDFKKQLLTSIQSVESGLDREPETRANKINSISVKVRNVEKAVEICSTCHHATDILEKQVSFQKRIVDYRQTLDNYFAAPADSRAAGMFKRKAAAIGNNLLAEAEEMSTQASGKLTPMMQDAIRKIKQAWISLSAILGLTFILGVIVAINLIRSITQPIDILLNATRSIAKGNIGHTISYEDKTEFGELARNFNDMSLSLKKSYTKLEEEINERKRTESALVKSEGFLNTVFDSIRDPFCIIDTDYRIVRANEAYAQMKQISLENLIGETCYESLYGRSSICDACTAQKTFLTGSPYAKGKGEITQAGVKAWREIYTYPVHDAKHNVAHVIIHTWDVTERKKAEDALRESEERYALAASGANDGLWDWDLRTDKIFYSHRWKTMLGYGEKEIRNLPEEWFSRVHPEDHAELESKISAHVSGKSPHFEGEFRIRHKDETHRWVLCRGLAVRKIDGQAYRMAGSQTDITQRKKAEEQLVYDAFHDALTGLPNRALFMDRLQHVLTTSRRRTDTRYAVLFLDMDRFKIINDSLGHTVGDQLLVVVGRQLSDCVRPGDTVARLGGDEFAVLLENINELADALDVTERILKKLLAPLHVMDHEVFTSGSIGVALGSDRYERPEQVLRDADIAMYEAKAKGSAGYEIFDIAMHASIIDRQQLEADLRGAMERKELLLHYQPIINLKEHRLVGFEVLVRWNHPKRGLLYPMEFIPLAEENGQINILGEWILRQACREMCQIQGRYPTQPPLRMSVNISGKQFTQHDFAATVAGILRETGLDPQTLVLELTESMLMENVDTAVATMKQLRSQGVHIHIDDFGTGYSSLSYLHNFPIDALKIDRTFINKLSADGRNQEIILSIISLANSLNFDVIAEGVELTHQLSTIEEMHCQYGQGYLFAQPMGQHEIDAWVQSEKYLN